jgi:hypothetical protein
LRAPDRYVYSCGSTAYVCLLTREEEDVYVCIRPALLPKATLPPRTCPAELSANYLCIAEPVRTGEEQPKRGILATRRSILTPLRTSRLNYCTLSSHTSLFIFYSSPCTLVMECNFLGHNHDPKAVRQLSSSSCWLLLFGGADDVLQLCWRAPTEECAANMCP